MIKTAVITDTNSGISVREGEEMGIYVLPMPVIVDGKEYTVGYTPEYVKVSIPVTKSGQIMQILCFEEGCDRIIGKC